MKRLLPIILAVSAIFSLAKGDPEPPRLIGFVNNDVAVLEANEVVPTASITRRRQVILKEGQSDFGLQLIKILPEEGAVKVLVSGGAITTQQSASRTMKHQLLSHPRELHLKTPTWKLF